MIKIKSKCMTLKAKSLLKALIYMGDIQMVQRKYVNQVFFGMISIFCLLFAFFCYLQAEASGESLWTKRVPVNTNLFADNRATAVGDTVTIVIREQTDILGIEDNELESASTFGSKIDASDFFVGKNRTESGQSSSLNNALPKHYW